MIRLMVEGTLASIMLLLVAVFSWSYDQFLVGAMFSLAALLNSISFIGLMYKVRSE